MRTEWLAGMEQQRSDPSALGVHRIPAASATLSARRHPLRRIDRRRHRRRQGGHARASACRFHRDFFGAQPAQFAVVGDFDAAALEKQVAHVVRQLEEREAVHARDQPTTSTSPPKEIVIETPDKAQAFFIAGLNLPLQRRRSRLSGAGARQLHAGRRVPQLAPHGAHPRQGWPELRRGFAVAGRQLRQGRRCS